MTDSPDCTCLRHAARAPLGAVMILLGTFAATALAGNDAASVAGYGPPPAFATHDGAPVYRAPAELEALVAPVALYPDELLAIVLPASTWPLQIVQAARFLAARASDPALGPDPAWDASVVALLDYPEVLARLDHELDWTARLGAAVVHQEGDVLAAVGAFRERARASGNLVSDTRQVVTRDAGVLAIHPAQPEVVYVPYYQPAQVVIQQHAPALYYHPRPRVFDPRWGAPHAWSGAAAWGLGPAFSIAWSSRNLHVRDRGRLRRWRDDARGGDWRDGRGRQDRYDRHERGRDGAGRGPAQRAEVPRRGGEYAAPPARVRADHAERRRPAALGGGGTRDAAPRNPGPAWRGAAGVAAPRAAGGMAESLTAGQAPARRAAGGPAGAL
ncbi:MAG: DUF3300 domain-containing protein, partial [Gammaproteobacteria bacterium]